MLKKLSRLFRKPPCPNCPYTLGTVSTLLNPCPECRAHDYATYETFRLTAGFVPHHLRGLNEEDR